MFIYELTSTDSVEKTVQGIIEDWNALAHLYAAVLEFGQIYKSK